MIDSNRLLQRAFGRRLARVVVPAALALGAAAGVHAALPSDIDIYSGFGGNAERPNVLLVLDSSANWSSTIPGAANCYYKDDGVVTANGPSASEQGKKIGIEKCALYNVIDALPTDPGTNNPTADALFNIGLMIFNESPAAHSGGYPRRAFIPLTSHNKAAFKNTIRNLDILADKGNNAAFGKTMYEAYLYFKGMAPYKGTAGRKWDGAAVSGGSYVSPSANSCGRNYVIFIANGAPGEVTDNEARDLLQSAGGSIAPITYPFSQVKNSDQANWADEYARFMRNADVSGKSDTQGIVTHGVAVVGAPSDGLYPNFVRSMATYGGGNYYEANNADVLVKALLDIFSQIQAVNSVFASASLPVSVNARGTFQNQIFMGMFRPDGDGRPRWRGNLKQYKFGLDALDQLFIVDANGNPAISGATGFISPSAVSYWSANSSFWANQPMGTPASASDSPDGEVVEKGGVAQQLRSAHATSQTSRRVLTCIGCGGGVTLGASAETRFDAGNSALTQALLGAADGTERAQVIDWVRGTSNRGDEAGPNTSPATTVRPSVHGDVLHSRPAVVNYGGSTGVVVFYGANDGQLRAVNGNQSGAGAGAELWSFVPEEQLPKLKRLRDNSPEIALSTTPDGLGAAPRDYFVDGPIGVYQKLDGSGASERVILFVGMRRGGRALYALDVTDPASPRFLWKKTAASAGMSLLGQTWSEPKAARVKGHPNPVVVFGGGYDAAAEDPYTSGTTTTGKAVFVLDAVDGTVLKTFSALSGVATAQSIQRSIAADVALVDTDYDGKVDRGYAADLGGQVYRIDFESAAGDTPAQWTVHKFADLSAGTASGRKFFYPPDVIVTKTFTALLIGSGDREKPLLGNTQDHFFQLFDRRTDKGAPAVATPVTWADLQAATDQPSIDGAGCYMPLATGEKVVNAATSIGGQTFFGTNRPSPPAGNTCSANLGIAKSYALPLFCTAAAGSTLVGGGLPPSPVAGIVVVQKPDGTSRQVPFVIGAPNPRNSAIEGSRINPLIDVPRRRRYWLQEVER